MINEKNKLQRKSSKWPLTYRNQYKHIRNEITHKIRQSKSRFYSTKLDRCAGDARGTWKVINDVLGRGRSNGNTVEYTDLEYNNTTLGNNNKDIADAFNEYFVNVGQSLANNIDSNDVDINCFLDKRALANFNLN